MKVFTIHDGYDLIGAHTFGTFSTMDKAKAAMALIKQSVAPKDADMSTLSILEVTVDPASTFVFGERCELTSSIQPEPKEPEVTPSPEEQNALKIEIEICKDSASILGAQSLTINGIPEDVWERLSDNNCDSVFVEDDDFFCVVEINPLVAQLVTKLEGWSPSWGSGKCFSPDEMFYILSLLDLQWLIDLDSD